jgi:hypothetical protein
MKNNENGNGKKNEYFYTMRDFPCFFSLGLWFCALLWTIGMCFFFENFNDGKMITFLA